MKTTIYWAIQHSRRAAHEFRFRITCWWLSQQVEFLARMTHDGSLRDCAVALRDRHAEPRDFETYLNSTQKRS